VDLSLNLKQRGVHETFNASLLRNHIPNDDHLFPGCLDMQIFEVENGEREWAVDRIVMHAESRKNSMFELLCYESEYLEVMGLESVMDLLPGNGRLPDDT
ncbi:hypothetical protein J132_10905, partial [Termitomyces sp. J132]